MRIAQVAPLYESVPPKTYGGTERVVSWLTEELVAFINAQLGKDLTPLFDQYLRRAALPTLELTFDEAAKTVAYRWNVEERSFANRFAHIR